MHANLARPLKGSSIVCIRQMFLYIHIYFLTFLGCPETLLLLLRAPGLQVTKILVIDSNFASIVVFEDSDSRQTENANSDLSSRHHRISRDPSLIRRVRVLYSQIVQTKNLELTHDRFARSPHCRGTQRGTTVTRLMLS